MTPWILACLTALSSWLYPAERIEPSRDLAEAIDVAAHAHPLPGDDGLPEMARELAVLSATEGHFAARAEGPDQFGVAFGAWQIHESTLRWMGRTPEDASDYGAGALLAAELVARSHSVCRRREHLDALGWYASGGPGCAVPEGLAASARRVKLADRLRREVPTVWIEPATE